MACQHQGGMHLQLSRPSGRLRRGHSEGLRGQQGRACRARSMPIFMVPAEEGQVPQAPCTRTGRLRHACVTMDRVASGSTQAACIMLL